MIDVTNEQLEYVETDRLLEALSRRGIAAAIALVRIDENEGPDRRVASIVFRGELLSVLWGTSQLFDNILESAEEQGLGWETIEQAINEIRNADEDGEDVDEDDQAT